MTQAIQPDYAQEFSCKRGDCRNSCCRGWRIALTDRDRARLVGTQATPQLRRRLERSIDTSVEGAAAFIRTETNSCPLLDRDGLCALQKESGSIALPEACRAFPCSVFSGEIAYSSSCEKVVELLFSREAPLIFLPLPHASDTSASAALRRGCQNVLQDRSVPLAHRTAALVEALWAMEGLEKSGDRFGLQKAIRGLRNGHREYAAPQEDWLQIALPLKTGMAYLRGHGKLDGYWRTCLQALSLPPQSEEWTQEHYRQARELYSQRKVAFEAAHPHWSEHRERLLCNHAFFRQFPLSEELCSFQAEALVFGVETALMQFVCVLCAHQDPSLPNLVDIVAGLSRLMEHSSFATRCVQLLSGSRLCSPDLLRETLLAL